jgi:hypothetical protein
MWSLGFVNRWMLLRGYFRVRELEMPRADRARLRMAVNPDTAAFIGPNHPEFGLDWIIDKELSTIAAPRMASWAAHDIVGTAPGFWTRNNLVANNGGEDAAEYSVRWALAGNGVLLHPEGKVRWTSDTVHPLFNGIATLASEAARRARRDGRGQRVFIVPVVWKLRHVDDISGALHNEMDQIARALQLDVDPRGEIAVKFHALQEALLARQMAAFGFNPAGIADLDFFARQEAFRDWLLYDLVARHRSALAEHATCDDKNCERAISRVRRVIAATPRGAARDTDLKRLSEVERLGGFTRDRYVSPSLTQEQIAESLRRIRSAMMRRGVRQLFAAYLPPPFGTRVAHVRVPEPIALDGMRASGDDAERANYVKWLVDQAHARMQLELDRLNGEIEPLVAPFRHANPFAAGS